jgi:hypothetical protein
MPDTPDTRLAATARYRRLATVCSCADLRCPCRRARRRADGVVHCPLCKSATPTLALDLRDGELRASCSAGCDPALVGTLLDDDTPLLALYGGDLSRDHARLLPDSAVAPRVASARPYSTVARAAGLGRLGFAKSQRNAPALVIPVRDVYGELATYQARPDEPRIVKGKPLKYETVAGDRMRIDVPPAVRGELGNPAVPLFLTEGARKADAAVSAGLCCIAVLGVWNWRGTNEWGGKTALADFESIAFKDAAGVGRKVYIVFDSDAMTKRSVYLALTRLKAFLESRGATVRAISLPANPDGSKVGLDDFLAAQRRGRPARPRHHRD